MIKIKKVVYTEKTAEEIFSMYSEFLSKYDRKNELDVAKNRQWNDDPFFQAMYKDILWNKMWV